MRSLPGPLFKYLDDLVRYLGYIGMSLTRRTTGLRFLKYAVMVSFLGPVLSLFSQLLWMNYLNRPFTVDMAEEGNSIIAIMTMLYIGAAIAEICSLVLLGIGVFNLKRDGEGVRGDQKRNADRAFLLFWIYMIIWISIFVWGFFTGLLETSSDIESIVIRNALFDLLMTTIGYISSMILILIFVLPLIGIAERKEKDLVIISVVLFFIGVLISVVSFVFLHTISLFSFDLGGPMALFYFLPSMLDTILYLGTLILLFIAYHRTHRILSGEIDDGASKVGFIEKKIPSLLGTERLFGRPFLLVGIFALIGMMVGAGSGLYSYYSFSDLFSEGSGGGSGYAPSWDDLIVTGSSKDMGGALQEGSSEEHLIEMDNYVQEIAITLTWEDEPDTPWYQNQPDSFTLFTVVRDREGGMIERTESGENPRDSEGRVKVVFVEGDLERVMVEEISIVVTLEEAGDYEPRVGPGLIIMTDGGNDYDIEVSITYYEVKESG